MRILVLQHLRVETPGVFLDFWREGGHDWRTVELDEGEPLPDLEPFDLMAVMGGPMDVWQEDRHPWLIAEKAAIRQWVTTLGRPYLGVCLGHQLLAEALGGKVTLMPRAEVGIERVTLTPSGRSDPFFGGLGPEVEALQWHGAEVSCLPVGATILASSSACGVQAMRFGSLAYGVQFHIEVSDQTTADWEKIPEYGASLEAALGVERAAALAGEVAAKLAGFNTSARRVNDNIMGIIAARR